MLSEGFQKISFWQKILPPQKWFAIGCGFVFMVAMVLYGGGDFLPNL